MRMDGRDDARCHERFEIRGKLGAGGMGVVYRAFDRDRGIEVALKTLQAATGSQLYRFKREFRSLADVVHPNLVGLHELHTIEGQWFITMELVDGVAFSDWLRPGRARARRSSLDDQTQPTLPGAAVRSGDAAPDAAAVLVDRLEPALYQLVDTVHALHLAGKLHRDLKPSNVLVDASGRVVVLDFGLIAELQSARPDQTHETSAIGTPAYMSPEQAADRPLGPASDWYSVGVMLYEALTGLRPVDVMGPPGAELLPLPAPRALAAGVPEQLDRLCMRLLAREPEDRPDGAAVLAALGKRPSPPSIELARQANAPRFVGREAELVSLRQALAEVRDGACVAFFLRGPSGMGKTSLLRRFLDETQAAIAPTVVLKGRCYERESVPFKTLDALVDALATHLVQLPARERRVLLAHDMTALARLFPVLLRVPDMAEPAMRSFLPPDPLELRRRGFAALRQLLSGIAARAPLVLAIDDVQWGDGDSGAFLAELVHGQDAPPLLLVACHRSEDEDVTPLLAALRALTREGVEARQSRRFRQLTLGPLSHLEAHELVTQVRGSDDSWVGHVVRESGGSPLFLSELARARREQGEPLTFEQALGERLGRLPEPARALLAVVAMAGRPVPGPIALRAAQLGSEGSLAAMLCSEKLLRVRRPPDSEAAFETYHDRVRAAVVARLDAEAQKRIHTALARAYECAAEVDHEAALVHWIEAGEPLPGAPHALAAAEQAESRVAFHRAAELYAFVLASARTTPGEERTLRTRLGHALAHAGRLDAAAAEFETAARDAPAAERLELQRLEIEQLLRAGRLAIGREKSVAVLAAVGERIPRGQLPALLALLGERARLRWRGWGSAGDDARLSPRELGGDGSRRIDVLWSLASALGFVSPLHGQLLQTRYSRYALASREPRYVGRALCLELCYRATAGQSERGRLEILRGRALAMGERLGDRELLGEAMASGGLASFLLGRWREAAERLRDAEVVLRDECTRVRWQRDILESFVVSALWNLGRTRELVHSVRTYLRAAEERGDAYAMRGLRGWRGNNMWLVLDRPDEARAQVASVAMPRDRDHPTQLTHFYELLANAQIDLYSGDPGRAFARVESTWGALARAFLLRIECLSIDAWWLRARTTLALAADSAPGERPGLLARARAAAAAIDRHGTAWGAPLATLVRAGVARLSAAPEQAMRDLRAAIVGLDAAEMKLYAAAARRRLGELAGGAEGDALVAGAEAFMRVQSIRRPDAMTRMLLPGG